MENLTVVIPFFNGHKYLGALLEDLPVELPVIIVDDQSEEPLQASSITRPNTTVVRPERKEYFTGAVNRGIELCNTDVLVLNQDIRLTGTGWLALLAEQRKEYALIGERIKGGHPAFPNGYVHGTFQFMRRDALDTVGLMDEVNYPIWGGSALWQWQICRKGYKSLPLPEVPGLDHHHHHTRPRGKWFGDSIHTLLEQEPDNFELFIRTPPLVSVIVPCYNYGKYLPDCLASLLGGSTSLGHMSGQTFSSFEVIIVNDGSTDHTEQIASNYLDGWNGVRYIYQNNAGMPAALNNGIRAALGKYITILSADDMREPWSLQDLYDAAERNPRRVIYDELVTFADGRRDRYWGLAEYNFENLLEKNMMHSGIFFPRGAWAAVNGYPEEFKFGREDWAFNVALGEAGYCGLKIGRSGYLYRREGQNRTLRNTTPEWRQAFMGQMQKRFPHLYRGVRPMACCGGGGNASRIARTVAAPNQRGITKAMATLMPDGEMVLVEYTGTSVGSQNWGGPGTSPSGRYYRFGNNAKDRVKYVAQEDVDWILGTRKENRDIFQLHTPEEAAPPPTPTGQINSAPVQTTGDLVAQKVQRVIQAEVPNPNELTIQQIRELTLTKEQWEQLLEMELADKDRTGVKTFAREKIEAYEAATPTE